ncbi:MAG: M23 family metallopeptidase [Rikenellaceae bacterium]
MKFNISLLAGVLIVTVACTPRSYIANRGFFSEDIAQQKSEYSAALEQKADNSSDAITSPGAESSANAEEENLTAQSVANTEANSAASLESEHVSITTYNPFAANGTNQLFIDLDAQVDDFAYPVYGKYSSPYGTRNGTIHEGIDISAPANSPIYAAFDGTVRLAKNYGDYGNTIVIRHTNGTETVYAHNAKNLVALGDEVEAGDEIALVGKSGNATGNHLHFEVRISGKTIDPELLLDVDSEGLHGGVVIVKQNTSGNISAERIEDDEVSVSSSKSEAISVSDPNASASSSKGVMVDGKVYDAPAPAAKPEVQAKYHTVVSGDTLSQIAEKYNVGLSVVYKLNNMNRNTVIRVGQKIRVQ